MAKISIREKHELSVDEVKNRVKELTSGLKKEYDVDCRPSGPNTIDVKRSGLKGRIVIEENCVVVDLNLSFLLNPLKDKIHSRVRSQLREALDRS